ncbi:MAG: MFS transporter [Phycisphaerae bacterium]|jgi:MFS family permease
MAQPQPGKRSTHADEGSGKAFGHAYWMLNSIEMFERLAYFGIRSVVPIYIMQATEPGGLHLTALHKGWIYAWWAVFQSFLPMVTGGYADRFGYKRVLAFAVSMNVVGYLMMAYFHSYYGFFAGILVLATGTAFFKPSLQGSLAQNLTKKNSSLGWGIFYWVVNIGAFGGPIFATIILGKPHSAEGWRNLFIASAAFTAINLFLLLTFKDVPSGADKTQNVIKVFWSTIENIWPYWFKGGKFAASRCIPGALVFLAGLAILIFTPFERTLARFEGLGWVESACGVTLLFVGVFVFLWLRSGRFVWQLRLPVWLLIMSCFWLMMYQLWDLHPNFIEDWIDSSMVAAHVPFDGWKEYGDRGIIRVPQQILLNLNAGLIILLILPISWLVRKMRTLSAMLIGMTVATTGVVVAGVTGNGWILLLGIVFFSLGEMLTGPKKNEYLGLIAPKGKKGVYLGYVNIPVGVGVGFGSWIAGHVYDNYGEKATLALNYLGANTQLVARAAQSADWSDSLDLVPGLLGFDRGRALDVAAEELRQDREATKATLRRAFRYDEGQITNLGLQYLALHPSHRESAARRLAELLGERQDDVAAKGLAQQLSQSPTAIDQIGVARFVDLLPNALDIRRPQVLEVVRDRMNHGKPSDQILEDAPIVEALWVQFADDAETLDNLALEYLAQGTAQAHDVAAAMTFDQPVKELESRLGIGRTKSFAALAAAMGADDPAVDKALSDAAGNLQDPADRAFVYLMQQPDHRFLSVARKDWNDDVTFLRHLIESDEGAMKIVEAGIDQIPWHLRLWSAAVGLFGGGQDDRPLFRRLADRQSLIHRALAAKNWSQSPHHARQLLRLNPYEARALAAAGVNEAPVTATRLLWDTYSPQYKVWLPFATIGFAAAIALGIFGRMARRWSDMNA